MLLLTMLVTLTQTAGVDIVATAPILSAEEHGVFSIHCQASNLGKTMEVTMYRLIGKNKDIPERLTLEESVKEEVPERVFLAHRQLIDGSKIYFLTLMDVTRADQGEYVCKVVDVIGSNPDLPSSSVTIDILYFPSDTDPVCSPIAGQVLVEAGKELVLNCSSEIGNPVVTIQWTKSRTDKVMDSKTVAGSDIAYSELRISPTSADNGAVFMCTISSSEFPDKSSSCHIGPIIVTGGTTESLPDIGHIPDDGQEEVTQKPPSGIENRPKNASSSDIVKRCKSVCDNKDLFHWVITTVICGLIALIFLIISIVLFIKYHLSSQLNSEEHYMPARNPRAEDIYTELEGRMGENSVVFMKLQKPIAPEQGIAIQR